LRKKQEPIIRQEELKKMKGVSGADNGKIPKGQKTITHHAEAVSRKKKKEV